MDTTISFKSEKIIKSTAHLVTKNDIEISKKMYEILFEKYPNLESLFSNAPENQYMKLAEILSAYAINIDKLDRFGPALQVIAQTHANSGVKSIHFPMVEMALIQAMEEILGEKASVEFLDAWREAYQVIGNILIKMEEELKG